MLTLKVELDPAPLRMEILWYSVRLKGWKSSTNLRDASLSKSRTYANMSLLSIISMEVNCANI
jgi:hypothetical protein